MFQKAKKVGITLSIIICSFLITLTVVAWTGPTQAPPNGNVSPPVDQSTTSQYKEGALGIGGVFETDMDTHLAITGGNVGVGTTSPVSKLQIKGTGKELRFQADSTNTDNSNAIVFDEGNGVDHFRIQYDGATGGGGGRLRFMPDGGSEVSILRNGNVGVGTTSPGAKLDVNGTVSANSFNLQGSSLSDLEMVRLNFVNDACIDIVQQLKNRGYSRCMYVADSGSGYNRWNSQPDCSASNTTQPDIWQKQDIWGMTSERAYYNNLGITCCSDQMPYFICQR